MANLKTEQTELRPIKIIRIDAREYYLPSLIFRYQSHAKFSSVPSMHKGMRFFKDEQSLDGLAILSNGPYEKREFLYGL